MNVSGAFFDEFCGLHKAQGLELRDHFADFVLSPAPIFLRMDRFEHARDLGDFTGRHMAKDVAVEVDDAALPLSVGEQFRGRVDESQAGIGDDQLHGR